jgi:hypothetical protein
VPEENVRNGRYWIKFENCKLQPNGWRNFSKKAGGIRNALPRRMLLTIGIYTIGEKKK